MDDCKNRLVGIVMHVIDCYDIHVAMKIEKAGIEPFVDRIMDWGYTSSVPPEYMADMIANEILAEQQRRRDGALWMWC